MTAYENTVSLKSGEDSVKPDEFDRANEKGTSGRKGGVEPWGQKGRLVLK